MPKKNRYHVGTILLIILSLHVSALIGTMLSNASIKGLLISFGYFLILYLLRRMRTSLAKWTIYSYIFFVSVFLIVQAPLTVQALMSLDVSVIMSNPEVLVYAFKQLSVFGYDSNYVGLITIILASAKNSAFYWILSFCTGARAAIVSALMFIITNKLINPNQLKVWLTLLIVVLIIYITVDFNEYSRSLYLKQLTVLSLYDNIRLGNYDVFFFGDGIESAADHSTVSGHTLFGTINKNGIFYVLFSLFILRVMLKLGNSQTSGPIFIVYCTSLISMTTIYFVLPLIFAIGLLEHDSASHKSS